MNLYAEFYPLALEMLEEFGAPAQLLRSSPASSTYDPVTDRVVEVEGATTPLPVRTVVTDLEWADDEGREVTRATAILTTKPQAGDTLQQGDFTYTIGRSRVIAPQGKAIIYQAEVS